MKLWTLSTLCAASLLLISGCATSPTPKENMVVDSSLPVIALTQNGIKVDMKTVAFEWSSIADPRVKGIYVYKKSPTLEGEAELAYFDTVESRFQTHYVDTKVSPDSKYTYVFKTFTSKSEGRESRPVDINTLPVLASVSWIHSITGMPRTAKIIWRPHGNEIVKAYIIERKTLQEEKWTKLATIQGRLNAEYLDKDLNDNYVYMYRVRVETYNDIISTPSQIVKVVTKALPLSIQNIHTTRNLANAVKIDWAVSTQEDFALYYLYRCEKIDGTYELIATLHNNTFTDKIAEDGKSYFYRVSAVDKDGLESEHAARSVQGMSLAKPSAPGIVNAKLVNGHIELAWSKADPRTVSYVVTRKEKKGWFDETVEDYEGIKSKSFTDKHLQSDSTYTYVVYSVDKHNIKSNPSIEVKIVTPESKKIQKAPKKKVVEEASVKTPTPTEVQEIVSPVEDLDLSEL